MPIVDSEYGQHFHGKLEKQRAKFIRSDLADQTLQISEGTIPHDPLAAYAKNLFHPVIYLAFKCYIRSTNLCRPISKPVQSIKNPGGDDKPLRIEAGTGGIHSPDTITCTRESLRISSTNDTIYEPYNRNVSMASHHRDSILRLKQIKFYRGPDAARGPVAAHVWTKVTIANEEPLTPTRREDRPAV
ncbi:hypothetical protein EVAR_10700_1 [Eumeta japonica]|uniref:Uncharacterized protein n=1 Tax=Eumeta variegata TaxID=151549 RepID=A0A4C1U7E8_EUMVA|nr:hypothetical protein EVAR_10700_1 [Eumeta japonica]